MGCKNGQLHGRSKRWIGGREVRNKALHQRKDAVNVMLQTRRKGCVALDFLAGLVFFNAKGPSRSKGSAILTIRLDLISWIAR